MEFLLTICSMDRLLKWEDQLRSHPGYVKAAIEASKVCIYAFMHLDSGRTDLGLPIRFSSPCQTIHQ